jgi:hypothetical protein
MFAKTTALVFISLAASLTAYADFSYITTSKTTGGSMAAMAGAMADRTNKFYFKGQKMMIATGDIATVIDFDAQTVTTINNAQKTYDVKKFSDMVSADVSADITLDVKETGQKKSVNGFNASEMLITMGVDTDSARGPAMKMQMELDMWVSSEVPGVSDLNAFYQRNLKMFPWNALMGSSGNASMEKAMVQLQRKMAGMNGVPVQQIVRIRPGDGSQTQMPQMPQMTPQQAAQMQAAMEQLSKQGGAGAAAAQQMMGRMGGMGRGAAAPSEPLIEMTNDASAFSSAAVPDSVFAIPAGYKQQ